MNERSIWCYSCKRQYSISINEMKCPQCHGGFIENVSTMLNPPLMNEIHLIATPYSFQQGPEIQHILSIELNYASQINIIGFILGLSLLQMRSGQRGISPLPNALLNPIINQSPNTADNGLANNLLGDYFLGTNDQLSTLAERLFAQNPQVLGTPPLSQAILDHIAVEPFNPKETKDTSCTICREELTEGEDVVVLECGHPFHFDCLKPWLQIHSNCPSCRMAIKDPNSK